MTSFRCTADVLSPRRCHHLYATALVISWSNVCSWARIQGVLKIKVTCTWLIWLHKNRFFFHANGCILTKLCLFVTFPSLRPFRFLPLPSPQIAASSLCEYCNSSQFTYRWNSLEPFLKLFAIHYGLTHCLFMRTLYDTSLGPTLSFQTYTIRQLDLMRKSWIMSYSIVDGLVVLC